jgi:hypothetical protein
MSDTPTPHTWNDWYRFSRDEFGYDHEECVEYANLRYVEEQNRESLRLRAEAYDALHAREYDRQAS